MAGPTVKNAPVEHFREEPARGVANSAIPEQIVTVQKELELTYLKQLSYQARMAELVDALDLKSSGQ